MPEENSLLLEFGETIMELPSIDLVFQEPRALLGETVHARFGDEFPIRFDFLDTMGGGNLSFQVHPLTEYIQRALRHALHAGRVVLPARCRGRRHRLPGNQEGHRSGRDGGRPGGGAARAKRRSMTSGSSNRWPAKKHDHFLIPAGTCHCSGANAMVLEISATPYIFTFKMWDWGRTGSTDCRAPSISTTESRTSSGSARPSGFGEHLINRFEEIATGDGWREERTGLHEREFIETRRHWFTGTVEHDTEGGVNVLNLVEGREAVVESPTGAFEPFVVHYAETFIVPAAVGPYTIRPHGESEGQECATV